MASKIYYRTDFIGGGTSTLDGIDGDTLVANDSAIVCVSGTTYHYTLTTNSGVEDSPNVIIPDLKADEKTWEINSIYSNFIINSAPTSDYLATGSQCNNITVGEGITIIDCVYLKSDGAWWKTDADATSTAEGMLAISLATTSSGNIMKVALPSSFVRNDTWNWTTGGKVYLSCTAGALTQTAPIGANDVVRVVGYAITTDIVWFNPDTYFTVV